MSETYVVAGTDTDVGKTVFAAGLVGALGARYWKPVQSGLDPSTDRQTVARLSGAGTDRLLAERYRLSRPLSPHRSAELDDVEIDPAALELPPNAARPLIVEMAGGLMVPLTRHTLFIEVAARWGRPVILCARTTLGTINHSLLSIAALRAHGVPIKGIAFIGEANDDSEGTVAAMGDVRRLGRLPRIDPLDAATLAAAFRASFDPADFARTRW